MKTSKLLMKAAIGASALALAAPAQAQDFYLGEVLMFGTSYCPKTSIETNGQILSIAQNQALFSILGTTYGGNGVTTFALPDQRGRVAYSTGKGPGLSNYALGQVGGSETVTLLVTQLPAHMHVGNLVAAAVPQNTDNPGNAALADFPPAAPPIYNNTVAPNVNMANDTVLVSPAGGGQPTPILSPYNVVRQCIMLQGIFPSQN